ncbi:unnamed protein product [Protopolystoma xenopodis]|uniref:Uncharacterized protein n=1 Tax=Protopolystoma xenopodis TaxID=117903 RepID=A0A448WP68_9PLAT|nr:unnamed protein product [Protopolystoma xenopodis]
MSRQAQRTLLLLCLHPNYNQVRRHALAHLTHLLSPPKSDSTSHPDDVSRVHSISISLLTSLTSCLAATLSSRRLTLSTTLPVDATVTTRIWQVYTSPITNVNSVLDHFCSESWQPGISAHLAVLIKLIVYVPSGLNRRFPSDGPSHIGHTRGRTVSDAGPVTGDALVCKKLSQKNRCHQPDLPTLEEKARRLELLVMATYASSFPILGISVKYESPI